MLVAPFLAMHTKHVYTCQMNVLQVFYDQICTNMLRDTWFEVFGLKIPFLQVLDCHNSPRRAITRHGEQTAHEACFTRLQLAVASYCSPPQQIYSPWRVRQSGNSLFCLLLAGMAFREAVFLRSIFTKVNPSNQDPKR
jgi:hypothetical protein